MMCFNYTWLSVSVEANIWTGNLIPVNALNYPLSKKKKEKVLKPFCLSISEAGKNIIYVFIYVFNFYYYCYTSYILLY